jgi:hypothetical protein
MPDGVVSTRDFVQVMDDGNGLDLAVGSGNTIIFDSFSPEAEVCKRNIGNNNISKLNNMSTRFATEFFVRVRAASVTAVLCAKTVQDYKVVDKKSGSAIAATDKRPEHIKALSCETESSTKRQRVVEPAVPANFTSRSCWPARHMHFPVITDGIFCNPGMPRCDQVTKIDNIFCNPGLPRCDRATKIFAPPLGLECLRRVAEETMRLHETKPNVANPGSMIEPSFTTSRPVIEPSVMTFRDSTSPTLLSCSEEEEEGDTPFPFKASPPITEQQPCIFSENALQPQSTLSDNVRAVVVSVEDVLNSTNVTEESQNVAKMLLELPDTIETSKGAALLQGFTSKSSAPPR